jgi:hypothetical protein
MQDTTTDTLSGMLNQFVEQEFVEQRTVRGTTCATHLMLNQTLALPDTIVPAFQHNTPASFPNTVPLTGTSPRNITSPRTLSPHILSSFILSPRALSPRATNGMGGGGGGWGASHGVAGVAGGSGGIGGGGMGGDRDRARGGGCQVWGSIQTNFSNESYAWGWEGGWGWGWGWGNEWDRRYQLSKVVVHYSNHKKYSVYGLLVNKYTRALTVENLQRSAACLILSSAALGGAAAALGGGGGDRRENQVLALLKDVRCCLYVVCMLFDCWT